jgi:hypothetical protein
VPRHERPRDGGASEDTLTVVDRVSTPADSADLAEAVRTASADRGINPTGLRLIHHYSNAVYYLPRERIVARVTRGVDAGRRIAMACRVTGWLVERQHFPATAPVPDVEPVQVSPHVTVSYWRYYPQPTGRPPTSDHLGRLLQTLHGIPEPPPIRLDQWVPLTALHAELTEHPENTEALGSAERAWLVDEVQRLREEIGHLDWRLGRGMIHGDAWAGNLLWDVAAGPDAAVLTDWDWLSYGPREIDLVPTWHAAARYGRGSAWTAAFVARYGYDLAGWTGLATLMRMRDLVQITGPLRRASDSEPHRAALRERLTAIRSGDVSGTWRAL